MKIVHLSTTDLGGAYKAVERIHKGMLQIGVDSVILLRSKYHEESSGKQVIDTPVSSLISKTKNVLNILRSSGDIISDYYGTDMSNYPDVQTADVLLVHWCNSFISYDGVKKLKRLGKPIYVVAHDMWSWTGGCHVDERCGRYEYGCSGCPKLPNRRKTIAVHNFERKKDCFSDIPLICPSEWSASSANKSDIWKSSIIFKIFNPLDYKVFYPILDVEKYELLKKYNIKNTTKKIILFGANLALNNNKKGGPVLNEIFNGLNMDDVQLVIYGNKADEKLEGCPIEVTYLGYIRDEQIMAEIYNMADVFLSPSKQESFGYTVNEALACGTPVVAYKVGGIAEQVVHKQNGYLAEYEHVSELIDGLKFCLSNLDMIRHSCDKQFGLSLINNDLKHIAEEYVKVLNNV